MAQIYRNFYTSEHQFCIGGVHQSNGSRTEQTEKAEGFTRQTATSLPGAFCIKLVSFANGGGET